MLPGVLHGESCQPAEFDVKTEKCGIFLSLHVTESDHAFGILSYKEFPCINGTIKH